ncbi:MAG: helix-turn-helix transcriptional regulator, partial [Acidimicrobiia bacterium]
AGVEAADGDATRAAVRARPTMALAIMLDMLGDGDGALEVLRGADTGPPAPRWNRPLLQFATAVTLHRRGEWDDALAEAEAGLVGADETDLLLGVQGPFAISAAISCARGRLREAHHWLERASRGAGSSTLGVEWMLYATAQVQEADGDPEGAAALLELFIDAALDAGAPALLLNSGGDAVRLAIAAGRPEMAARVTRGLVEVAGRTESPIARATADWARGLSRNDPGPAIAAAGRLTGCQRVPEAARARHDAAVIAARLGNKDEARALAGETFRTYDTLGAEQLHGRLRAELRSAGLPMRPRRSRPRPQSGWESLTPSEQRVVDLVGEGLTNSEIADRLYLSRRTVESHLGRVYTKLDLMTRAQLVAAVVQRRETVGSS